MSAIGAVVATILVATYAGHRKAWVAQPTLALVFGGALVLLAATQSFVAGLVAICIVGALASGFQSLNNSLTISMSDEAYHGRVQSTRYVLHRCFLYDDHLWLLPSSA